MYENEFKIINLAIKNRLNKKVKGLKKLYQALIDGDDNTIFHTKCDNISNTLVLIKSAGNRRFGGFTSILWTSSKMVNLKMILMHFYFLLINKEFILIIKKGKLFDIVKDMDLVLDIVILILDNIALKRRHYILFVNQILILVIIIIQIKMLYLNVKIVILMQLIMKCFKLYLNNYIKLRK